MKVIFLTKTGFVRQHLQDMYIEAVRGLFEVELWDLSAIYKRNDELPNRLASDKVLSSFAELDQALGEIAGQALIVTNIMFYSLKRIYPYIKKHHLEVAAIFKEGLFSYLNEISWYNLNPRNGGLIDVFKILVKRLSWIRIPYNRIVNGSARYDYLFATNNFYPEYARQFIKVHYVKYDEYLAFRGAPSVLAGPYALFLDSAATTHPTYKYTSRSNLDGDRYIRLMNEFFDFLEAQSGLPVVIAAHPKAGYTEETFNGRPIILGQTPALIEHCSFAFGHFTTAFINAILANKPVGFLYYREMLRCGQKFITIGGMELGKLLQAPVINLEKLKPFPIEVNAPAYDQFINTFVLDAQHPDQTTEEIFLDFLQTYAAKGPANA